MSVDPSGTSFSDPTFEELSATISRYPDPDDKLTIALGNFNRVRAERDEAKQELASTLNSARPAVAYTGKEAPRSANCRGRDTEGEASMPTKANGPRKAGDNTGRKIDKAREDVIFAARVAVLGDDDDSDPNLRELRKALRKLDRLKL